MDRFHQTPFQMGFSDTNDYALLCRAVEATNLYSLVQHYVQDGLSSLTVEQARTIARLHKALKKHG